MASKQSALNKIEKLLEEARTDLGSVTVGMSSLCGDDHFTLTKLPNPTDVEYTILSFRSSVPAHTVLAAISLWAF